MVAKGSVQQKGGVRGPHLATTRPLQVHRVLQSPSTAGTFAMASSAFSAREGVLRVDHGRAGVAVAIAVLLQAAMGMALQMGLRDVAHFRWYKVLRFTHRLSGYGLLGCAWLNCYLGVEFIARHDAAEGLRALMVGWWSALGAVAAVLELRRRGALCFRVSVSRFMSRKHRDQRRKETSLLEMSSLNFLAAKTPLKEISDANGSDVDEEALPGYTWARINAQVQQGAQLAVFRGMVLDLGPWIKAHPGGQRVLWDAVGTDITPDLVGNTSAPAVARGSATEDSSSQCSCHWRTSGGSRARCWCCSGWCTATGLSALRARSSHSHSPSAIRRALKLVIGQLVDDDDNAAQAPTTQTAAPALLAGLRRRMPTAGLSLSALATSVKQRVNAHGHFARFTLVARSSDSNLSTSRPVIVLTLQAPSSHPPLNPSPGQHMILQVRVRAVLANSRHHAASCEQLRSRRGMVVSRPYTPLRSEGYGASAYEFHIKVYPAVCNSLPVGCALLHLRKPTMSPRELCRRHSQTWTCFRKFGFEVLWALLY